MDVAEATIVQKVIAYVTRHDRELLVFDGPDHEELQVPKGTVEPSETPREALFREIVEESGLATLGPTRHLTTDVWRRRRSPPRLYVRHVFHASAHEPRDGWHHVVEGEGPEHGHTYEFSWLPLPTDAEFALALDDHLPVLTESFSAKRSRGDRPFTEG